MQECGRRQLVLRADQHFLTCATGVEHAAALRFTGFVLYPEICLCDPARCHVGKGGIHRPRRSTVVYHPHATTDSSRSPDLRANRRVKLAWRSRHVGNDRVSDP